LKKIEFGLKRPGIIFGTEPGSTSQRPWWVGPACKDRNDHQPPGSSYVSDTVLFSHE